MTLVAAHSAVLHFSGELDSAASPGARQAFADLPPGARVVIDLSDVTFVDSAGLGTLIGGIRRSRERGGDAAICSPNTRITRVFHVTGVDRMVPIVATVEDGVSVLTPPDDRCDGL